MDHTLLSCDFVDIVCIEMALEIVSLVWLYATIHCDWGGGDNACTIGSSL